jgi:hypothetical protein
MKRRRGASFSPLSLPEELAIVGSEPTAAEALAKRCFVEVRGHVVSVGISRSDSEDGLAGTGGDHHPTVPAPIAHRAFRSRPRHAA